MSSRPPPVPPAGRSPKGPGDPGTATKDDAKPPENLAEQGRQGNVKQNTTNQGHQQDR
ncbi:MAG: hypothetical protein AB7I59_19510 [Geminicoccaceae bacterium]